MLSKKHLNDYCLYNSGNINEQCRYLDTPDSNNEYRFVCLKLLQTRKKNIDLCVKNLAEQCKRENRDISSENMPLGNNCDGYPFLLKVIQGYDV